MMKTVAPPKKERSQVLESCRKIQSQWSRAERLQRRRERQARRLELMQLLGLLEPETQVA